jgi:ABC-type Fe3+ transport system substrate-binding protein
MFQVDRKPRWPCTGLAARTHKFRIAMTYGSIAALMLLAFLIPARASDEARIAAAKKEGEVIWYTTLIVDQAVRPMVAAFEAKYPGIKVRFARYNSGDIALRIINEAQAGQTQADIFDGGQVALYKTDLLESYLPANASQYAKQFVDPDGRSIAFCMYVLGPGINTDLLRPADAPKTFQDLLDPKWVGKIAWSSNPNVDGGPGFVGLVLRTMGQEKGMDYLRKLSRQKIANVPAASRVVLDQVIGGQYTLALVTFNHHSTLSAAKGAPVKFLNMEPLMGITHSVSLVKNGPHPNAGRLFIDFLMSDEGQNVFREAGYIPTNPRVPPKVSELSPLSGGFAVEWILARDIVDTMPEWIRIYNELFK